MIGSFQGKYRWLSNFAWCPVVYDDAVYPTVEHAYQASKTLKLLERMDVQIATSAGEAKKLGRQVTLRPDWNTVKLSIMEKLLRQKFFIHEFSNKLLDTGDEEIVEVNTWGDTYWGVCNGHGQNQLGKLLMKIREDLRDRANTTKD